MHNKSSTIWFLFVHVLVVYCLLRPANPGLFLLFQAQDQCCLLLWLLLLLLLFFNCLRLCHHWCLLHRYKFYMFSYMINWVRWTESAFQASNPLSLTFTRLCSFTCASGIVIWHTAACLSNKTRSHDDPNWYHTSAAGWVSQYRQMKDGGLLSRMQVSCPFYKTLRLGYERDAYGYDSG